MFLSSTKLFTIDIKSQMIKTYYSQEEASYMWNQINYLLQIFNQNHEHLDVDNNFIRNIIHMANRLTTHVSSIIIPPNNNIQSNNMLFEFRSNVVTVIKIIFDHYVPEDLDLLDVLQGEFFKI